MSGGMGYYAGDLYDENDDGSQSFDPGPGSQTGRQQQTNPLRDHLKKVETQNEELQKQLAALLRENRAGKITASLQAKGYDPAVANLYGDRDPEKLDEWLTSVGPLLAKQPPAPTDQGQGQQQGQPPASTVSAEAQAAQQQMQGMGHNAAPPQGSEAEQIAQMRNAQDPAALMQYLQSQGNPHYWNG